MATLEAHQPPHYAESSPVPLGHVPSAFPDEELERGRASGAKPVTQTTAVGASRSPPPVAGSHLAGSQERRSSLARAMDSVRRVVTRDQSQGGSQERGRRQSFASEGEPRASHSGQTRPIS